MPLRRFLPLAALLVLLALPLLLAAQQAPVADAIAAAGPDAASGGGGVIGNSLWDTLQRGGKVMYVILAVSVVGLMFILEVSWRTRRAAMLPAASARALEGRRADTAGPIIAELLAKAPDVAFHRMLRAGDLWRHGSLEQTTAAIEEAVDTALWSSKKAVRPIGILANIAPLLGLLGTVLGIIDAFDVVARQGALGDPGALAEAISKALLTTCFGLIVAIPLLLAYHFLNGRVETLLHHAEELAKEVYLLPPAEVLPAAPLAGTAPEPVAPPTAPAVAPEPDAAPEPKRSGKSGRAAKS